MDETAPRLVLRGVAWKWGLNSIGSTLLTFLSFWMWDAGFEVRRIPAEMTPWLMVVCMAVSAVSAAYSFIHLCWPPEIVLTDQGFEWRTVGRSRFFSWEDVERFEALELRGNKTVVAFMLHPEARARRGTVALVRGEFDGTLPVLAEEGPTRIVQILSDWRWRHSSPE